MSAATARAGAARVETGTTARNLVDANKGSAEIAVATLFLWATGIGMMCGLAILVTLPGARLLIMGRAWMALPNADQAAVSGAEFRIAKWVAR